MEIYPYLICSCIILDPSPAWWASFLSLFANKCLTLLFPSSLFLACSIFFSSKNTPSPDYIIWTIFGLYNPKLFEPFGACSTLKDHYAKVHWLGSDYIIYTCFTHSKLYKPKCVKHPVESQHLW